jgi:hypothetical protein
MNNKRKMKKKRKLNPLTHTHTHTHTQPVMQTWRQMDSKHQTLRRD